MSVDLAQLGIAVRSDGVVVASNRLDELEKHSKKAETAVERLEKQFAKVGKQMQMVGRNFSLYLTTPILGVVTASIKMGATFDSTMTKMNTLAGISREEIAGFRKEILAIGPSLGKGPAELADALFRITSAGQSGQLAMDTLRNAAMASAIGLGETKDVAIVATAAVQAYGEANMTAARAMEILIGTVEKGNVEASELAPELGRVIGIAAELGVQFEDVGAFIATFTRLGINASEATTALSGTLNSLLKPTKEAEDAFASMGLTVNELRRQVKEEGFIITFQELITKSRQAGVDIASIIPNVRALAGVLGVFGGEGKLAIEILEGVTDTAGAVTERFKDMKEQDPTFAFKALKAEAESLMIVLSQKLLPAATEIAGEIRDLIQGFGELSPETQTNVLRVVALAAAIGPLLIALGSLIRLIGLLLPLLTRMGFLLSPAGLIAVGLALIGKIIADMYIAHLEKAIGLTTQFTTSLEKLKTVAGATGNLKAINEELDNLFKDRSEVGAQMEAVQVQIDNLKKSFDWTGTIGLLEEQMAGLAEEMADIDKVIENQIQLRDDYTARVREAILAEQELAKVVTTPPTGEDTTGPSIVSFTEDEVDALEELLDLIDPVTQAKKELAAAQALLNKALKAEKIDPTMFDKLSKALARSQLAMDALGDAAFKLRDLNPVIMANLESSFEFVDSLKEMSDQVNALRDNLDPLGASLRGLAASRELVNDAWASGALEDPAVYQELVTNIDLAEEALLNMNKSFEEATNEWIGALSELSGLFEQDSKEAEALNTVIQLLNVALGIQAVIKQLAEGDVYSAIPRALGVAAMIASMGVHTGASGSAHAGRTMQQTQGTGSVLGDSEEKSESIMRATEITANATTELVGINRGMLHALQNLQTGLGGATVQLARGAGATDFGAIPKGWDFSAAFGAGKMNLLGLNIVGEILNKLFGGKSKLLDEGIRIMGGYLDDLTSEVMVQAWRQISVKKSIFHKTKIKDEFMDLGDEVATQFALVFESIRDTVTEAALALGLPLAEIQQRISEFQIATTNISFKDLNAEEQREELLAVFGKIFDDLAGAVVPFIDQFQKVGEGLGETLVRVATSVQVFREAILAFGFAVDTADPETFAQLAVGLIELTGGVNEFVSQFTNFFDRFASDGQKLVFITDQLTRAFEEVGLAVPNTREAMFELMTTLDATTEEGQAQIAMLLRITDVADEYFNLMEAGTRAMLTEAQKLARVVGDFVGIGDSSALRQLTDSFKEAMAAAKALNATQREYAMITRAFNLQLKRMAAELTLSALSLIQRLFGSGASGGGITTEKPDNPIVRGLEETRQVANSVFEEWKDALKDIFDYTQQLLLDEELTTLTPAQQLAEAQRQFDQLLGKARGGDLEAAKALPKAADALLEEARFMYASGRQYSDIFDSTLSALKGVSIPSNVPEFLTEVIEKDKADPITEIVEPINALVDKLERYLLAVDLSTILRDLANVLGVNVLDLAEELGVPLRELAVILGVELDKLTKATTEGLAEMAMLLGADVFELMDRLGVGLADLAVAFGVNIGQMTQDLVFALGAFAEALGVDVLILVDKLGLSIKDLAATFGLGIEEFSAAQFKALIDFSNALGTGIADIAAALDINLGDIRDATSLLSQGLNLAIGELPPEIQSELGPMLLDIQEATTQADANNAINHLGEYILGLPSEIAAPLIPFLDAMNFKHIAPELSALFDIEQNTRDTVAAINAIDFSSLAKATESTAAATSSTAPIVRIISKTPINSLMTSPTIATSGGFLEPIRINPYLGSYAAGGYIDQTGGYQLHAGEFVVNRSAGNLSLEPSNELSTQELVEIRNVLSDIRDQTRRYYEADLATSKGIEANMKLQAEQTRRIANG